MSTTETFEFNKDNLATYKEYLTRYDDVESALLPVLHLAQEQNGWLPDHVVSYISLLMSIPEIKIKEVISFYDMFYDVPVGRNIVQVCTNISCSMFGGREIYQGLLKHFDTGYLTPTRDGRISLQKMECLGACELAPCMRVNDDFVGNLDLTSAIQKLEELP
ncbi:MAG: NAD(P)H-dependent oxidoreductase subunit E [Bacteriovorax sp.]|nr:NAD(P)H-dependent oxidoreductase subunit E [Bacteriovorax sp.]